MSYDYRAARDWVFGIRRDAETDKIAGYVPMPGSTMDRAVLLALVEFAPNIEPSTAALAKMLGTSERQVRRLLRRCEQLGLLTVRKRTGKRSEYVLTMTDPGLLVLPREASKPRTNSPPTPDCPSSPPRTNRPPKQTSKADKKADKISEPFRLDGSAPPVADSGKAKTGKAAKPKRAEPTAPPGAYKQVVDCYFEAFKAQHGREPVFDGVEGRAVNRLLAKLKGDALEACRRVRNAFTTFRAASVTIRAIASTPDAFASPETPRGGAAVQRGPHDAELIARLRAEGTANA
ncbi:MAG TPA: hypothetical protein VHW01_05240 [Polyangiaceae bacterium]|nr:hypothetical protein [Polyangiaceae bacterium]